MLTAVGVILSTILGSSRKSKIAAVTAVAIVVAGTVLFGIANSNGNLTQAEKDRRLLDAVVDTKLRKFESLLEAGANPNVVFGKRAKDWVMCQVADQGRLPFLKLAIQHGGDINLRNPHTTKSTVKAIFSAPLLCAIRMHNDEAFEYLLDAGVDVDIEACTECKKARLRGSAVTVAEHGNEYKMTVELIKRRGGKLSEFEIKSLIHGIERTTLNESSDENVWRLELAEWLRGKGYEVTPWTSSSN